MSFFYKLFAKKEDVATPKNNDLDEELIEKLDDGLKIRIIHPVYRRIEDAIVNGNMKNTRMIGIIFVNHCHYYGKSKVFPYDEIKTGMADLNKNIFNGHRAPQHKMY